MQHTELRALIARSKLSQGQFANELEVNRTTVNHWCTGTIALPRLAEMAIRWWAFSRTKGVKPAARRKRLHGFPRVLEKKNCPGCGGVLWFKQIKRNSPPHIVYCGTCKTHQQNPVACPINFVYFDEKGTLIEKLPRFVPPPHKRFRFDRPKCELCKGPDGRKLQMTPTKPKLRVIVRGGRIVQQKTIRFFCTGGRWGTPKHPHRHVYTNMKGGIVTVSKGRNRRLVGLPAGFYQNWPQHCGQPMARVRSRYYVRLNKKLHWFRCSLYPNCKSKPSHLAFDDSAKPYAPYGWRNKKLCPRCKEPLVKAIGAKSFPWLQALVCNNYKVPQHTLRKFYVHRKNGAEYVVIGRGSRWEARCQKWSAEPASDLTSSERP